MMMPIALHSALHVRYTQVAQKTIDKECFNEYLYDRCVSWGPLSCFRDEM